MTTRKSLNRIGQERRRKELTRKTVRTRYLNFESLEDRRLLAINLNYFGPGSSLQLFDLEGSMDMDHVSVTQPSTDTLKIDLGG